MVNSKFKVGQRIRFSPSAKFQHGIPIPAHQAAGAKLVILKVEIYRKQTPNEHFVYSVTPKDSLYPYWYAEDDLLPCVEKENIVVIDEEI